MIAQILRLTPKLLRHPYPPVSTLRPQSTTATKFDISKSGLTISTPRVGSIHFPYAWLRDSCQCPSCVHPSTQQKVHRSSDSGISEAIPSSDGVKYQSRDHSIQIRWHDGHSSFFPLNFLERYSATSRTSAFHKEVKRKIWDAAAIARDADLFVPYSGLRDPEIRLSALRQLLSRGLMIVKEVPTEETSNDKCELRRLANFFGDIRTTFYGETWDVRNVPKSTNIAYTDLNLDLHMDLLYMEHPPKIQILHCLRNKVDGGTSIFVDAFGAAERLRQNNLDAFDTLASTDVSFHYINDNHHLHRTRRTIELDPGSNNIKYINYSPPFQAPLPLESSTPAFYKALHEFVEQLDSEANRFQYTLQEGDAAIFDNRSVLHARTAFTERSDVRLAEGETNRWLKGCYLEEDAIRDYSRTLGEKEKAA